jgi:hypothetical protein
MKQVNKITVEDLWEMSNNMYDDLVKAVVDIERGLVVVDAGLHADEEAFLLEKGSNQSDLWGINLYPNNYGTDDFIEFDSMINIRPQQNNRSRSVENVEIQEQIRKLIAKVVYE